MLGTHSTNRITVDNTTKEFSIRLNRVGNGKPFVPTDIRLVAYKRECKKAKTPLFELNPYAVKDGYAFFTIEGILRTACIDAGMYDVKVMDCNCEVDSFELLKAPMVYISDMHVHDSQCGDDKRGGDDWQEPNHCPPKKKKKKKKEINCDCPNIEDEIIVPTVNLGEPI